ncbi:MAG: LLM class F420-dependent oxidoreductase [bacterium]|nr:LLM class F420-dependent oxidoreductase [Deltaproteobacteria bacterium]MCP4904894.1 LLM class F420-dependent oxidoreductase [bacterium]
MSESVRLTFKTLPSGTEWETLLGWWLEAEGIEALDGGWLFDHFYPIYGDPSGPCFEGWTALSYLAGRTQRLRLGLMVTGNPYRHPTVLANMAATYDVFSEGRLDLGLGAGWNELEANAYGIPFGTMGERLDSLEEAIPLIKSLFREKVTNFEGVHYTVRDAYCEPKPRQPGGPPLTIGGQGEKRTLRIAARFADDWNFPGGTPEQFAHKIDVLHEHCTDVGRDPREIVCSTHVIAGAEFNETADNAAAFVEAGASHLCLYFFDLSDRAVLGKTVEAVSAVLGH